MPRCKDEGGGKGACPGGLWGAAPAVPTGLPWGLGAFRLGRLTGGLRTREESRGHQDRHGARNVGSTRPSRDSIAATSRGQGRCG